MTPGSPANLAFSISGKKIDALQASDEPNCTSWYSGSATTANIALVNLNTAAMTLPWTTLRSTRWHQRGAVPEPASITLLGSGLAGAFVAKPQEPGLSPSAWPPSRPALAGFSCARYLVMALLAHGMAQYACPGRSLVRERFSGRAILMVSFAAVVHAFPGQIPFFSCPWPCCAQAS